MWKPVLMTIALVLGVYASPAHATFNYRTCVASKVAMLESVTKSNAASKLRANFSIEFLASQTVGGGGKWKAMDEGDKVAIRGLFSNPVVIGPLYDHFAGYKNVTEVKYPGKVTTSPTLIANIKAGGKKHKLTFYFAENSCTLLNLCKGGICVSDQFRVNRALAKVAPKPTS